MANFKQKKNNGGYAILFAVVVVSIISMLAIGMSNTTYKQLVLSSLANDSQLSFYQSDTATQCALYSDNILSMNSGSYAEWRCGKNDNDEDFIFEVSNITGGLNDYSLRPKISGTPIPCFEFDVTKGAETNIYARGYNSCDKTNQKTVEREIKVTY